MNLPPNFAIEDITSFGVEGLIDAIEKYGSMEVFCVMEKDENMDLIIDAIASKKDHDDAVNNAVFRRGNVRSGQEIVCDEGIIIVGDVHSGARIESGGNIVVLGELKGTAIAGAGNNTDTFVVAMSMDPVQIQIGDVLARNTDRDNMSSMQKGEVNPQIATVYEDRILIEPLLKSKNTH